MSDALLTLFGDHGPTVLAWLLALLTGVLVRYVWVKVGNEYVRGVLERAWQEVKAAVAEVAQVYADALKAANKDGKLTDREKAEAKNLAIEVAKSNLGKKGLAALARILGAGDAVEKWLGNKVEAAVKSLKPATASALPPQPAQPRAKLRR